MRIFKSNKPTNYKTFVGGESFNKEEAKQTTKLTTNTYLTREEYNKSRITKELNELEQELRVKQGQEFYKERVKQIKQEIKYKHKELKEQGKRARASKVSKWELLKELLSFK
ncbi:hypothetical protein [Clostridium perfringens]|uniref:hypothetical protein n=1 Tax=Clostridium perfringens TaxID=1502 RepID=UPI0024686B59|nr:hypothetical protein [Clostridium perfringens]MDH5067165.1 hypothetical protein [Clostridium perfringens]